jgi:hypothetical protein
MLTNACHLCFQFQALQESQPKSSFSFRLFTKVSQTVYLKQFYVTNLGFGWAISLVVVTLCGPKSTLTRHSFSSPVVAFDKISKRRKVFKVETIGDSYVAVTGLPGKHTIYLH